jgi:hypothetical protein
MVSAIIARRLEKTPTVAFVAMLIARMSGDRVLDIHDNLRKDVLNKFKNSKSPQSWFELVAQSKRIK